MNRRRAALCGAWLSAAAVVLGAFAAHGLRGRLEPQWLDIFHTGVEYHLLHAIGLLGVAAVWDLGAERWMRWSATALCLGLLVFSGSLYALALTGQRALGVITPLGGAGMIVGWILLAIGLRPRRGGRT